MTSELAKINQFQTIGDDLVVTMTSEVTDIQADLEKKYPVSAIPADLSVKENYELVKSAIRDIKKPRISLEKDRKSISSVPYNLCKKINAAAKPISESLVALESSWKDTKTAYDDKVAKEKAEKAKADEARIDAILEKIESIKMAPIVNMDKSSTELQAILDSTRADSSDLSWADEYAETAQDTIAATTERLETLIAAKKAQEEVDRQQKEAAAKLEADQKAADEKAQADREEQDLRNKVEADRLEKEREDFEAEKKKLREKQEAMDLEAKKIEDKRLANIKKEDDERTAKIKAENDAAEAKEDARLADIKREEDEKVAKAKADQDKKDADAKEKADKEEEDRLAFIDEENRSTRIGEAAAQIQSLLDSDNADTAFDIVTAIINGKIPHISFT